MPPYNFPHGWMRAANAGNFNSDETTDRPLEDLTTLPYLRERTREQQERREAIFQKDITRNRGNSQNLAAPLSCDRINSPRGAALSQ